MLFTSSERRLLALLVLFLACGFVITALRGAGVGLPGFDSRTANAPSPVEGSSPGPFDEDALPSLEPITTAAVEEPEEAEQEPSAQPPREDGDTRAFDPRAPSSNAGFVNGFLDLNRADSASLVALPGIGPALAGRILTARRNAGGFRTLSDLEQVRGIGPRRLEELGRLVTVGDPAGSGGRPPAPSPTERGPLQKRTPPSSLE